MANRYPAFGNVLAHPPFDAVADPRKYFHVEDDFVSGLTTTGNIGSLGWTLQQTNGSVAYSSEAEAPGVLTLTAATSGFTTGIHLPVDVVKVGTNGLYYAARIKIPTAVTNRLVRVGFTDAATSTTTPTQGAFVEFDVSNETEFTFNVDDNSTDTEKVSNVTVAADTWYTVEIVVTQNDAAAYVDGELLTDPITESTIASTEGLTPFAYVGDGSNAQTLAVDFIAVRQRVARAGFTAE